jgi:zinc protease
VKEYFLKSHQDNLKENGYWMGVLDNFYYDNLFMVNDYVKLVNQLSTESLKAFMQKTFSPDQTIEVVMKPAL